MAVTVIGHRGAAGVKPENTLAGFRYAIGLGVDAVECDVHLTYDGHVIVMHDETVDRTTDGTGLVAELSLATIRGLDAGDGQNVPTLEELLAEVRGRCRLLCELKADGVEGPAVEAVLARGMEKDVTFISFSLERLAQVKRRGGQLRIGAILAAPRSADIDKAAGLGAELVGLQYKRVSAAAVERVRKAGMLANVWTPNQLPEMQAMIALGADAITTDRPDILLDYLNQQGQR
jgi:glycerophosphoryl diester phosphodiesterase